MDPFPFQTSPQLLCLLSYENNLNPTIETKFTKQQFINNTKQRQMSWRIERLRAVPSLNASESSDCLGQHRVNRWNHGKARELAGSVEGLIVPRCRAMGGWWVVGSGMTWRVTARFNSAKVRLPAVSNAKTKIRNWDSLFMSSPFSLVVHSRVSDHCTIRKMASYRVRFLSTRPDQKRFEWGSVCIARSFWLIWEL